MKVNIAGIEKGSMKDGPGVRNVIFFQGCPHHCPGCHNPETWDIHGGGPRDIDTLIDYVIEPNVDITISGGEPFLQVDALLDICIACKNAGKNVWVFTGYTIETIKRDVPHTLKYIDVIVDGRYDETQRDLGKFKGSKNQRICYIENGQVIKIEQ